MSFGEVEHFGNMVDGCESINKGMLHTNEAIYAKSVLQLYTPTFGAVAGQEGFLDSVKAGAQKTGEFIKKLFAAIKKWFSDVFKSTRGKFASLFKGDDKEKAAMRDKIRATCIPKIEALKKAATATPDDVKTDGFAQVADKAIASLGEGSSPNDVVTGINALLTAIENVSDSFIRYCGAVMPKKQMDSHAPYDKAVKEYKAWGEKANALTIAIAQLYQAKTNK